MKRVSIKPFSAKITLGLEKGYSKESIDKSLVIKFIQNYQDQLVNDKGLLLSISLSECTIILSGQEEPHLNLNFINSFIINLYSSIRHDKEYDHTRMPTNNWQ